MKYISIIIGVIIVVVVSSFFYFHSQKKSSNNPENVKEYSNAESDAMDNAAQADHAGQFSYESKVLTSYLNTNPPKQYRYLPLIQLAALAYNKGNFSQAISYYKEAEANTGKIQETDAAGIAMSAQAEGDKATAIYYYKLAIKDTDVQPGLANSIVDYKETITSLGGTP